MSANLEEAAPLIQQVEDSTDEGIDKTSEVKPGRLLAVMTSMFFLIYMDRGVVSCTSVNGEKRSKDKPDGSGFQGEFDLSNFQDGVLSSLFMVGVLVASPIFSQSTRHVNPMRLVAIGTTIWAISVAAGGLSWNFYSLAFCRTLVGAGEAAIIAIGPPFIGRVTIKPVSAKIYSIDDVAPKERVTSWLAVLFLSVPCGYALGFAFGMATEAMFGWRGSFISNAILMVPFIIFCFFAKPIKLNTGDSQVERGTSEIDQLKKDVKVLLSHPAYVVNIAGNIFHIGVLGVLSYWGGKAAKAVFHKRGTDLWISGTVFIDGTIGIISSGLILDKIGSSISNAFYMSVVADVLGGIVIIPMFLLINNFVLFLGVFCVCFYCVFVQMTPASAIALWTVPPALRPLGSSVNLIVYHILGDLPSPAIFGLLLDILEDKFDVSEDKAYRRILSLAGVFLLVAAGIYYHGVKVAKSAKDYRETAASLSERDESESQVP